MLAIEKMIKVECSGSLKSPRIASCCQHCEQNLVLPAEPTEDSAETSFPSLGSCLFSLSRLKTASPNIVHILQHGETMTARKDVNEGQFGSRLLKLLTQVEKKQLLSQKWICEHNHCRLCQVKCRSTFLSVYVCVCPSSAGFLSRPCLF